MLGAYEIEYDGKGANIYDLRKKLSSGLRSFYNDVKVKVDGDSCRIIIENVPEESEGHIKKIISDFQKRLGDTSFKIKEFTYKENKIKNSEKNDIDYEKILKPYESRIKKLEKEINEIQKDIEHKDYQIKFHKDEIEKLQNENQKLQHENQDLKTQLNNYSKMDLPEFLETKLKGLSQNLKKYDEALKNSIPDPGCSAEYLFEALKISKEDPIKLISEKYQEIRSKEDLEKINKLTKNDEEIKKLENEAKTAKEELEYLNRLLSGAISDMPESIKQNLIKTLESNKERNENIIKTYTETVSQIEKCCEMKKYIDDVYKKHEIGKNLSEKINNLKPIEIPVVIIEKNDITKLSIPIGSNDDSCYFSKIIEHISSNKITEQKKKIIEEGLFSIETQTSLENIEKGILENYKNLPEELRKVIKLKIISTKEKEI
ncbi:MAG: hypothetical protein QW469_02835 [Candidatus Aenigmatarchaeota archaeon]